LARVLRGKLLISALAAVLISCGGGCALIVPTKAHKPVIRNPFPQLRRVAVAPFFNQSDEPTVDGRRVALAYFAELQSTPGFEVVPLNVVEEAMIANRVDLNGPNEARRLAQILGVDAVAVGSVTDFTEYYPPRVGLRVEWYAANPGFHEIPAGYGLPWNTPEEEFIPDSLVYESQMALARQQMEGLSPDCEGACQQLPAPPSMPAADGEPAPPSPNPMPASAKQTKQRDANVKLAQVIEDAPRDAGLELDAANGGASGAAAGATIGASVTTDHPWLGTPCPTAPLGARPPCIPNDGPVLSHTKIYTGNDADVTEALEGYVFFRDDNRFGGWQSYLSRSDEFVRFCCHMHISEMLSARGGSRKTDVVWRWPESR
jgi:hypothetical protein